MVCLSSQHQKNMPLHHDRDVNDIRPRNDLTVEPNNRDVEHHINELQLENLSGLLNSWAKGNCLCITTRMSTTRG